MFKSTILLILSFSKFKIFEAQYYFRALINSFAFLIIFGSLKFVHEKNIKMAYIKTNKGMGDHFILMSEFHFKRNIVAIALYWSVKKKIFGSDIAFTDNMYNIQQQV